MQHNYCFELLCDYPQWWRYNVYIMAVGYAEEGGAGVFNNLVDKAGETVSDEHAPRRILLMTEPCAFLDLYIYIVANTPPPSDSIHESPPFPATLRIMADGEPLSEQILDVDQLGGLALVAQRVSR